MTCEAWNEKIDAFIDAELAPDETTSFEQHLRTCMACSQETLARQRLKAETRLAGLRYLPNEAFERRLRERLTPRKRRTAWLPAFAGAMAVLVVAIVGGLLWKQHATQKEVVAQLVDQHVSALASEHPVDVVSTDSHTVKPWFAGKVPFSVDVPDLSGTSFELIGGRVVYLRQAPAAHLTFGIRKHRISVFLMRESPESSALANDSGPVRRGGFNTQTWVEDGIRYFAISDVNPQDIGGLCELLKKSSGS